MLGYFIAIALLSAVAAFSPMSANTRFASRISMVKMPPPPKIPKSEVGVASTVKASADHKTLASALKANGLDTVLDGPGPFVLFAPTDAAFAEFKGKADAEVLKFHVSKNTQLPSRNGRAYPTLALHPDGEPKEVAVRVTVDTAESFLLGGQEKMSKVVSTIQTSNGYIHVVDTVLLPYEGKFPPYMAIKEPIPSGYTTPKAG